MAFSPLAIPSRMLIRDCISSKSSTSMRYADGWPCSVICTIFLGLHCVIFLRNAYQITCAILKNHFLRRCGFIRTVRINSHLHLLNLFRVYYLAILYGMSFDFIATGFFNTRHSRSNIFDDLKFPVRPGFPNGNGSRENSIPANKLAQQSKSSHLNKLDDCSAWRKPSVGATPRRDLKLAQQTKRSHLKKFMDYSAWRKPSVGATPASRFEAFDRAWAPLQQRILPFRATPNPSKLID